MKQVRVFSKSVTLCHLWFQISAFALCLFPLPARPSLHPSQPSLTEITLSSAFSVTHTQKWDVSLPPQSVSVTALTPGWDSGHFALFFSPSFFSLSFPPSTSTSLLSPPTRHLVSRWSWCGRSKLLLCSNLPSAEKLAAGQREGGREGRMEEKKKQWTPSAVIRVQ